MDKLAVALGLLRNDTLLEKLAKGPGVLGGLANIVRSGDRAGQAASKFLQSKGHKNLAVAARFAPHAVGVAAVKKVHDSDTVQKMKRKYRIYKVRKAMRVAQRGY
jgi:hypothetical protein